MGRGDSPILAMTFEQALILALSSVVGALCFLFKLLWKRADECEQWRMQKGALIERMAEQLGIHTGITRMVNTCNVPDCPYSGKLIPETFSIHSTAKNTSEP